MDILHDENDGKGMFYVGDLDAPRAAMYYHRPPDGLLVIDHTEVGEGLRGQNVGYFLVKASVDYARENDLKIIPVCPFARSVFEKNPSLGDVLQR